MLEIKVSEQELVALKSIATAYGEPVNDEAAIASLVVKSLIISDGDGWLVTEKGLWVLVQSTAD